MPMLTAQEVTDLLSAVANPTDMTVTVTAVEENEVTLHLAYSDKMIRPGGSIGGPILMTLADAAIYAAVLAELGPETMAMTTNLNINFLQRAFESDLTAKAKLLKLGKRLAIAEVEIFDDKQECIAHVTGSYSLPPKKPKPSFAEDLTASQASIDRALAALNLGEASNEEPVVEPEPATSEAPEAAGQPAESEDTDGDAPTEATEAEASSQENKVGEEAENNPDNLPSEQNETDNQASEDPEELSTSDLMAFINKNDH